MWLRVREFGLSVGICRESILSTGTSLTFSNTSPWFRLIFLGQCGLSASEGDTKLQDELSRLINQQLRLDTSTQKPPAPITYITQHYHHSGHLASPSTSGQEDSSQQLASHGINVSALSPSQVNLFSNALPEQQSRLIELWQIAPPNAADRHAGNWPQTSLQQEEDAARERYLKMTSPMTLGESSKADILQSQSQVSQQQQAEPYILNGYATNQDLTAAERSRTSTQRVVDYNRARDPVYQGREWWSHANDQSQPMEHQYGNFAQMRNFYGNSQQEDEEML